MPDEKVKRSTGDTDAAAADSKKEIGGVDLPISESGAIGPAVSVVLGKDDIEMILTDQAEDAVDMVANVDFHAVFIKDQEVTGHLDKYGEATAEFSEEEATTTATGKVATVNPEQYLPLTRRLRDKESYCKVILTPKKKMPADMHSLIHKYVVRLCTRLDLSVHDRVLITGAGDIYALMKFRHPDHGSGGFKSLADAAAKCFPLLNEEPVIIKILRSMYCNLEKKEADSMTIELVGSNILTITDMFSDMLHGEGMLTHDKFQILRREFGELSGKMFLKEVAEAFMAVLEEELPGRHETPKRNGIVIYTDRTDRFYPLETRLKNEGFQPITVDTLELFVTTCRRRRPDIIVLRYQALPREIVKNLQLFSGKGINVSTIPTFLLVRGIFVDHMAPLLETGIVDILDLEGSLDVLTVKLRKVRTQLEADSKKAREAAQPQSGSRGNLSEMNLIDLLQALGPSQKTVRITVKTEEPAAQPLLMYLSQGQITYALLGELVGEVAIHRALTWSSGTWLVEPVADEDLPEPNNSLSNESILLEGCRLLDESGRIPIAT